MYLLSRPATTLQVLVVLFTAALLPAAAQAATIDFRSTVFAGADHLPSFTATLDGLAVTVEALPAPDATLYWRARNGLAVRHAYERDEIEGDEVLRTRFERPVRLETLHLTRIFNEDGYLETGFYRIDGEADAVQFWAGTDQRPGVSSGDLALYVGREVETLDLFAPGRLGRQDHEFSLGGFSYSELRLPTPEPGSTLLFSAGALVVGLALRRASLAG